ncbi:unnamed protein product [Clonostachys rosea]|uniref:Uncharacterized protein n=1 Tax=Bionectria ochroleuca TaxID=29856 RepID=A0ABY6V2L7_BIOOC|nr:unnamed protein product [Clonostachys rosea]
MIAKRIRAPRLRLQAVHVRIPAPPAAAARPRAIEVLEAADARGALRGHDEAAGPGPAGEGGQDDDVGACGDDAEGGRIADGVGAVGVAYGVGGGAGAGGYVVVEDGLAGTHFRRESGGRDGLLRSLWVGEFGNWLAVGKGASEKSGSIGQV